MKNQHKGAIENGIYKGFFFGPLRTPFNQRGNVVISHIFPFNLTVDGHTDTETSKLSPCCTEW